MKILFLYNKKKSRLKSSNNSHDYGLSVLRSMGVDVHFLEIESIFGERVGSLLRKFVSIHFIHLFIFPLFFKYDVVYSSTAISSLWLMCVLRRLCIKTPKWIVLSFNLSYVYRSLQSTRGKILLYAIKSADGIVALSEAERISLAEILPEKSNNIRFIRFFVNTDIFKPVDVKEEDFILSVGHDPGRDYDTLLKAIDGTNLKLKITAKKSQVNKLGKLPDNVSVNNFSSEELIEAYAKSLIVVIPLKPNPGSNDSMGCSTLLESMSMGKCIIVTDTNHMRSYVEGNKTGILVPIGDNDRLRTALLELIGDKDYRDNIGRHARGFVEANCSADMYASKLHKFFVEIYNQNDR